jgi:ribosomal protein S18 acetylase RimI-like enzyme
MLILHDKNEIEAFLQKDVFLYTYSLGDLDDFFWPYTIWYAAKQNGEVKAVVLLYIAQQLPVMLALTDELEPMQALLRSIMHLLPRRFYTHLSPGLEEILGQQFHLEPHGQYYKMALRDSSPLKTVDISPAVRLSNADLEAVTRLYEMSYPGNWFDPRMLETNHYFGLKGDQGLLSIAGVHVYSRAYGVAALGNIATHPAYRGRGYGKIVTAKLCTTLLETVDHIGLNVNSDNHQAIAVYEKLGFEVVAPYREYMVEAKNST